MRGCFGLVLLASVAFFCTPPAGAQALVTAPTVPVVALIDVSVIPMDRERVLAHQTVLVRGDRIAALGPVSRVPVPAGAMRVDGRGKFLLPGLADMHVHLKGTAAAGEKTLWLFLANGVTTVRDMHSTRDGGANSVPMVLRRQVARGERVGPRIYTAGDPDNGSPEAAARSVDSLRDLSPDFVKIGHEGVAGPVYDSVLASARRAGLRLVGHVPVERGLERVLQDRWASIEHLSGYHDYLLGTKDVMVAIPANQELQGWVDTARWMRPGYQLDPSSLRRIAAATRRAGVWNCPTLSLVPLAVAMMTASVNTTSTDTAVAARFNHSVLPVMRRLSDLSLQVAKALQDAGAGLLLGADVSESAGGPGLVAGFAIHEELATLVQAGLTPYQALATGTRNVAAFLGTLDSTGTVAVGKRADLVLLSGNPLQDIGYTAGPAGVMVGGRWLPRAALEARLDSLPLTDKEKRARQRIWRH